MAEIRLRNAKLAARPGPSCRWRPRSLPFAVLIAGLGFETALAQVPGVIKEGKMEKYKGRDYWTFEIATPGSTGSKKITEVAVDPNTGKVVWSGTE